MSIIIKTRNEFLEFPQSTHSYLFSMLFPEKFNFLRQAKFQNLRNNTLAQITMENLKKWTKDDHDNFRDFLILWTDFTFILMSNRSSFTQEVPNSFGWHSGFDTRSYRDTCVLYETIMLWHTRALIHYHNALAHEKISGIINESTIENGIILAQVEMSSALDIWSVCCKMFITAWKTRNETRLPVECREDGNAFYSRVAILKLEFYELCLLLIHTKQLLVGPTTTISFSQGFELNRVVELCQKVAFSSNECQRFLDIARGAHSSSGMFSVNNKSLLSDNLDFSIYETFALFLYSNIALARVKATNLSGNAGLAKWLIATCKALIARTRVWSPEKIPSIFKKVVPRQPKTLLCDIIFEHYQLCFANQMSLIERFLNIPSTSFSSKKEINKNLNNDFAFQQQPGFLWTIIKVDDNYPFIVGEQVSKKLGFLEIALEKPWNEILQKVLFHK